MYMRKNRCGENTGCEKSRDRPERLFSASAGSEAPAGSGAGAPAGFRELLFKQNLLFRQKLLFGC